ncbi:MAG: acyl--CoA ligase, partial [Melioribacteraceae bacterium]|nr:acyl--CoA ligase [Melioribacteraceae bacterium]
MSNTEFNFSHNQHQNDLAIVAGKKTIRYSELTQIVNRTANYYLAKGISPKDKIGILSGNTTEFVIACFALWRINAIPIPLNIKLNLYELKKIIIFSDCKFILKSDEFKKILSEFDSISLSASDSSSDIEYENETNENDTAVIIFTSGTSGSPKGVELTNNNLFESFISINSSFNFSSNDKFLASLPFYHIGGFSMITRALLSGGTLLIPESLKTNDIAESLFKNDPTIISLVSTMLKRLIDNKISPNKNLRIAFIGGGPSDDDLILDSMNVGWPLVKVYGSTETSSMITGLSGSDLRKRPASAGLQFGENIIKIMNDSGNELGIDEVGEICV